MSDEISHAFHSKINAFFLWMNNKYVDLQDGRISTHADPMSTPCAVLIGTRLRELFQPWTLLTLFRELNKTAKFKGVNIDSVPTLIGIRPTRVGIVRLEFAKIKGAKNNFAFRIANC